MKRFRIEEKGIALDDRAQAFLPYEDVLCLIVAVHRHRTETATHTKETKFSATRAVLTGGVSVTKTVRKDSRTSSDDREPVMYVFRQSGATPWLLHERGTQWAGNGLPTASSASENFRLTVAALKARLPDAVYDERLLTRRALPERTAMSGSANDKTVRTSSQAGVDLLAHLIALWAARVEKTRPSA